MATELDTRIREAMAALSSGSTDTAFDYEAYRRAFQGSAIEKAKAVLSLLEESDCPMRTQRPIFLSIGGGDASELDHLLRNSTATHGILLEGARPLAEAARRRVSPLSAIGKTLEIYEGDAKEKIDEACADARKRVRAGNADFLAVTCHAVIHELFDRGKEAFDPLAFFASIFEDPDISTWFTYREPGTPEKWPDEVDPKNWTTS